MAIIDSPALQRSGHSDDAAPEADTLASEHDPASVASPGGDDRPAESPAVATALPASAGLPSAAPGRQSAFLAELARAMNAAADAQRSVVLERAALDARAFIEQVQARSAEESAELKRHADTDVAGIREWSKAEIARIREETEARIADRKAALDAELEQHAATVASELGRVEQRAAAFEAEMTAFFERLLQEPDPARFAALAANLPEPPSFDAVAASDESDAAIERARGERAESETETEARIEGAVAGDASEPPLGDQDAAAGDSATTTETAVESEGANTTATGEHVSSADVAADVAGADLPGDEHMEHSLAEAEAAAAADAVDGDVEEPAEEERERGTGSVWAARLAGIVGRGQAEPATTEAQVDAAAPTQVTQVVVVGLVSVASIAGFKRQLGHLPGVASVAVSSGPDGEFVFRVSHGDDLVIRDSIATLPGFQARVVSFAAGIVHVSARDPEAEA